MKHTPGPWTVDETYSDASGVLGADGFPVAEIEVFAVLPGYSTKFGRKHWAGDEGRSYIERDTEECEANARLIAAAPEMRDQLEKAADTFGDFRKVLDLFGRPTLAEAARIPETAIRALLEKLDG